jgi:hypothetical protein
MKKEQFVARLQHLNLQEKEIERKWRTYIREKEEQQLLYQTFKNVQIVPIVNPVSPVTAGGGGTYSGTSAYTSAEMLIYVDSDDQWKMVVANFDNGTISQPINTGIFYDGGSSTIYSNWEISHGKGFMITFTNGPLSRTECFFVNSSGALLFNQDQFGPIITSGGFSYGTLNYIGTWFADYEPDGQPTTEIIMTMFDGEQVIRHILPGTSNISVHGLFGNLGAVVTLTRTAGGTETYLLRWNGTAELLFTHEIDIVHSINCNHKTDFIVVLDQEGTGDFNYLRARKWTGANLVLEETPLNGGGLVNNYQTYNIYGSSKFISIFYNTGDNTIDYLIYQTSLSGTNLDTHPNNGDYSSVNLFTTDIDILHPANLINEKAVVIFSSAAAGSAVPGFSEYNYFSILYYTEDGTSYGLNVADGTLMAVQYTDSNVGRGGVYSKDPVFSIFDPADITNLEFTLLRDSGFSSVATDIVLTDLANINVYTVAPDYFLVEYTLSSETSLFCDLYSSIGKIEEGILSNTVTYDTPPVNRGGIVIIDDADVTNSFVWGSSTLKVPATGLIQGSTYQILGFPNVSNDFGTINALAPGYQVVLETLNGDFQPTRFYIVSEKGWQGPFETEEGLGDSPSSEIALGETIFHYLYQRFDDNIWVYNSYSLLTGALINTYNTGYTATNNTWDYGDRFSIQIDDGIGNWVYVYPTKNGSTKTITVPQTSTSQSWNDAYWAYD